MARGYVVYDVQFTTFTGVYKREERWGREAEDKNI